MLYGSSCLRDPTSLLEGNEWCRTRLILTWFSSCSLPFAASSLDTPKLCLRTSSTCVVHSWALGASADWQLTCPSSLRLSALWSSLSSTAHSSVFSFSSSCYDPFICSPCTCVCVWVCVCLCVCVTDISTSPSLSEIHMRSCVGFSIFLRKCWLMFQLLASHLFSSSLILSICVALPPNFSTEFLFCSLSHLFIFFFCCIESSFQHALCLFFITLLTWSSVILSFTSDCRVVHSES